MVQDAPAQPDRWYLDAAPSTVSAWLTRLQWARCGADAAVLLMSLLLATADFPLRRLAPVIAATALIYGDIALRRGRGQAVPRIEAGLAVALDVLLLTGLLELTGGPSNPFSVIYAVPVFLAGITLGSLWGWLIAAVAAAAYGVLIAWHLEELVPSHHRLIDFPTHLFTMWLAIALLGEALAHVIREASTAITRREGQLEMMRQHAARQERLISLTTLAAGAAHELSTPLGTIAVASRELERALTWAQGDASWVADARLIRDQADRCHTILDQMSGRAGGGTADRSGSRAAGQPHACDRKTPALASRDHARRDRDRAVAANGAVGSGDDRDADAKRLLRWPRAPPRGAGLRRSGRRPDPIGVGWTGLHDPGRTVVRSGVRGGRCRYRGCGT